MIRAETAADKEKIFSVVQQAFPTAAEAQLVNALREKGEAQISLVAEQDGVIIGHILFSPMAVSNEDGQKLSFTASGLAPVSVLPAHQKQGVGSALIKKGVEELKAKEIDACFLLGDPAYYSRSGFQPETNIIPPYPLPDEWQGAWQSRSLVANGKAPQGKLLVPDVWMKKALWTD